MESWFEPIFRIPFTIYWVSRDLRTKSRWRFMLSRKMWDSSVGYYFEAV